MRLHLILPLAIASGCAPPAAADVIAALPLLDGAPPIAVGESLQARIDAAPAGAVLTLQPGDHRGPVRLDRAITLQGTRAAAIVSDGRGSTVSLADGASLRGCSVVGSGDRFDLLDSAVRIGGDGVQVEGIEVRGALFGILVQLARQVVVRGNTVLGSGQAAMGLRGDGIRLWETTDSIVEANVVRDCRDVVVWYSSRNRVLDNVITGCRYGTHFMYSNDNVARGNRYVDDVVGVFVMYSRDLHLAQNLLARAGGAAGIGLGVKESGNLLVEDNWFVQDSVGIYLDSAPLDPAHHNRFLRNVVRLCDTALSFHASTTRNDFVDNSFADNGVTVLVGGQGNALGCSFHDNHFDVYRGYDLDGDGRGDLPFTSRQLSSQLEGRYPDLALLHGAPAMQMVDLAGELLPLFEPRQLLVDGSPRLYAPTPLWRPTDERP